MTALILFDECAKDHERSLDSLARTLSITANNHLHFVNLSDCPVDLINKAIKLPESQVTYTNGFELYSKIDEDFNVSLAAWLENLLQLRPVYWNLRYSRISELNFSIPLFQNLRKIHLIRYLLESTSPNELIYIGDRNLGHWLSKTPLAKNARIYLIPPKNVYRRRVGRSIEYFRALMLFTSNFFSELLLLFLLRIFSRRSKSFVRNSGVVAIYALFPRNWRRVGEHSTYRYTSHLFEHYPDISSYYLISFLRTNSDALERFWTGFQSLTNLLRSKDQNNYEILENYGSFKDLLASYLNLENLFRWVQSSRRARSNRCWNFCGVSVEEVMAPIALHAFREIPKNLYTERCSYRAARHLTPTTLYIPVFELLEGRAITKGHKTAKVQTVGIQHGIMYSLQVTRAISSLAVLNNNSNSTLVPDLIAVEGKVTENLFLRYGFQESTIHTVGAPRLEPSNLESMIAPTIVRKDPVDIVIFGDLYSSSNLFNLSKILAEHLIVVFRPHPAKDSFFISKNNQRFTIEQENISTTELINTYQPIAALYCMSGIALEILELEIPLIFSPSNEYPLLNPVIPEVSRVPTLQNVDDIVRELMQLKHDPSYQSLRKIAGRECLGELVKDTGNEACRNLTKVIDFEPEEVQK
tara:strand:- start:2916 stop:4835 length:1920 start_codon:yes stop_codon:yes gene_type:complete